MCGVVGVVRFDGKSVDPAIVAAMTDQLVHRGPDDRGDLGQWSGLASVTADFRSSMWLALRSRWLPHDEPTPRCVQR